MSQFILELASNPHIIKFPLAVTGLSHAHECEIVFLTLTFDLLATNFLSVLLSEKFRTLLRACVYDDGMNERTERD